jgi:hypothetical protein
MRSPLAPLPFPRIDSARKIIYCGGLCCLNVLHNHRQLDTKNLVNATQGCYQQPWIADPHVVQANAEAWEILALLKATLLCATKMRGG